MELYNLGKVPWLESQLIYHALAGLGRESLCLLSPAEPYVCIGFHQDLEQEVDLDFCAENDIPVFRREVGGGAVYLDGKQLFFQLILDKEHPEIPKNREAFYKKFLQPILAVYRSIGIAAEYKPVNDVLAGTRKISGTGVGEIGDCVVFVGNLIMDFNYEMMAKVLKVPDEKFRDKIHKTLEANLSTIIRELGPEAAKQWSEASLSSMMVEEFEKLLGPMEPCEKDRELQVRMDELAVEMSSDAWRFQKGKRIPDRNVKIRAGVNMVHRMHKAAGGLIRADIEVREGTFGNVSLSGDFFCYPGEAVSWLEAKLEGRAVTETRMLVEELYAEKKVDTPGIGIEDWMQILDGGTP